MKRIPPHVFFFISAIFHYLGPAFAVLLFAHVAVLGVMWLRIASAAVVFAIWRRPWRLFASMPPAQRWLLLALGVVLGLMNSCFYEAITRLPLGTVAAIEFIGPVMLAAAGARTSRNVAAFLLAVGGGWLLTHARFANEPLGYAFAFANGALFLLYIVLGHRIAADGAANGIDRLAAAMLVAAVTALPIGFGDALPALRSPLLLFAGIGVGISSSVIPYVCDQLAMARLPRASFALLLSLLPATSTVIGLLVLRQVPTLRDLAGVVLVAIGVALHRPRDLDAPSDVNRLTEAALSDSQALAIVAHLADDIGARPCGSKNAALAVEWTTRQFREWGIDVRNEPVLVPRWIRGVERATIVSHNDQPLVLSAFGGSVATPERGIVAEVVERTSFEQLDASIAGKIVYFDNPMDMTLVRAGRALEAYQRAAIFRAEGCSRAAKHRAVAVLIRSLASASLRTPHTGAVRYDSDVPKIPGASLSAEDAMLVHRLLARGDRVRVHLTLQSSMLPEVESANVIAEIRGREHPGEIVLLGAHLDSWDVGTGAVDNASGVAMVIETMRLFRVLELAPKRTIRCVLFMNEEFGQSGSRAYFAAHHHENHIAAIEADMGASSPAGFTTSLQGAALSALRRRMAWKLQPSDETGVDTAPLVRAGVPGFGFAPDATHYFDVHHTAADTLDKVDPHDLARGAAAIASLTWTLGVNGV
jgi:inner membrane transporter RhtA